MGFTIANYSLLGLQNIQNLYVSVQGSYTVKKEVSLIVNPIAEASNSSAGITLPGLTMPYYSITYTVNFQASKNAPVITKIPMYFNLQLLPSNNDIYLVIYDNVKSVLDPGYKTEAQTLEFTDDITEQV